MSLLCFLGQLVVADCRKLEPSSVVIWLSVVW